MESALFWGLATIAACWVVHWGVWRIRAPKGYLVWLPTIFWLLPSAAPLSSGRLGTGCRRPRRTGSCGPFVLREYSFGIRDLFVQCVIVAERMEKDPTAAVSLMSEHTIRA
jgi:hypothetical protein